VHPLRVLFFASVAVAAAVALAISHLLIRIGEPQRTATILGICAFVAFMIPWSGAFAWALRRASDLQTLTDRARDFERPIHDRDFHGELDDLARGVEELRQAMLRERTWAAEQRSTMSQIAAALGEGLLALSPRGTVVLANARVRELFGTIDEIEGRTLPEVVRSHSLHAAFDRARAGETSSERIEVGERQIEMRVFPVTTSHEVVAVALFIDVTQIERLQRTRQEFLDDFSHEVRTPLTALRSSVETLDGGGVSAEDEAQLRAVITRQLARLERLVRDLAELNRIESGELVLERRDVDLTSLLRDLAAEFRGRTPLRFTVTGDETIASVDPLRVQQIFSNLFDNAAKHGGRGEVLVEVSREDAAVVVRVSDEGEGIPPHELDRIFHRFYRVDKSRSQTVPGIGLGLAIVKHLVLLHGGTIRALNRPAGGATFEVRLPAAVV
jgi:two-component system phosphate regulon sensor histidine kinase PhoR